MVGCGRGVVLLFCVTTRRQRFVAFGVFLVQGDVKPSFTFLCFFLSIDIYGKILVGTALA